MQAYRSIIRLSLQTTRKNQVSFFTVSSKIKMRDLENDTCAVPRIPTEHVEPEEEIPDRMYPYHMYRYVNNKTYSVIKDEPIKRSMIRNFIFDEHMIVKDGTISYKVSQSCKILLDETFYTSFLY